MNLYLIKWDRDFRGTFGYGSRINFEDDQVTYSNPLMSPGESIHSWSSKTDYQSDGEFPDLPLLHRGHQYQISWVMSVFPETGVYMTILFFDLTGTIIEERPVSNQEIFTYPDAAQSYAVKLMNIKHELIEFNYLCITEATEQNFSQVEFELVPEFDGLLLLRNANTKKVRLKTYPSRSTQLVTLDESVGRAYFSPQMMKVENYLGPIQASLKSKYGLDLEEELD